MIRSCLYVPGDRPAMLAKAPQRGADLLILDLEDAVAPNAKGDARRIVQETIPTLAAASARFAIRINSEPEEQEADLAALADTAASTLVVPKATTAALGDLTKRIQGLEIARPLRLVALIESARGLWDALSIAEHPWVVGLASGEQDLAADLGMEPTADSAPWHSARSRLVWAAAAAGLPGPAGPVWTDFADLAGLRDFTLSLRRGGFASGTAIHPAQVSVINEVFTPTTEELAQARDLVERYDKALAEGLGVITDGQGKMVDEAVVRRSRYLLGVEDNQRD